MMPRMPSHITETESRTIFERAIIRFWCEEIGLFRGDVIFRQVTERDYGIDGIVELFRNGNPTGRTAYIQLKGTGKVIEKLKRSDEVSCAGISKCNLLYCQQNNIPVMLVYVSTADEKFYYLNLQSVYKEKLEQTGISDMYSVRIPLENNSGNLRRFFEIINSYYDEKEIRHPEPEREAKTVTAETDAEDNPFVVTYPDTPGNGKYGQVSRQGRLVASGLWKDGSLEKGTEYDWLIHITEGRLIYKPDCPEDPYDTTANFAYEKLEQYAWEPLTPFLLSRPYLEQDRLDRFYVVDMEIEEDMEQIVNIRPLFEFLQEREPKLLCRLQKWQAEMPQGAGMTV